VCVIASTYLKIGPKLLKLGLFWCTLPLQIQILRVRNGWSFTGIWAVTLGKSMFQIGCTLVTEMFRFNLVLLPQNHMKHLYFQNCQQLRPRTSLCYKPLPALCAMTSGSNTSYGQDQYALSRGFAASTRYMKSPMRGYNTGSRADESTLEDWIFNTTSGRMWSVTICIPPYLCGTTQT